MDLLLLQEKPSGLLKCVLEVASAPAEPRGSIKYLLGEDDGLKFNW